MRTTAAFDLATSITLEGRNFLLGWKSRSFAPDPPVAEVRSPTSPYTRDRACAKAEKPFPGPRGRYYGGKPVSRRRSSSSIVSVARAAGCGPGNRWRRAVSPARRSRHRLRGGFQRRRSRRSLPGDGPEARGTGSDDATIILHTAAFDFEVRSSTRRLVKPIETFTLIPGWGPDRPRRSSLVAAWRLGQSSPERIATTNSDSSPIRA